ncbi:MAG: SHOCT domain-containing protein [Candidatus Marinimicrobia bacterium]|nr:SHOCT domain-containing protein [Candidatus Neomarinimicrobiota bacterium]MCF7839972.1 SHOCT domain-containing protein [Candidatus Neomarinimicrobiota bacterium]
MFSHGWFGGMMWWGVLFWIAIIGLVVWVGKTLVANSSHNKQNQSEGPEAILKRRYARGEITREQYEEMMKDISR